MDEKELNEYQDMVDGSEYLDWMKDFEDAINLCEAMSDQIDIDYNIVDDLYKENFTPAEAVLAYWNRI